MTDGMMNFGDLVEKAPDADFLREMISFAAERLMELEVGAMTGAAYGRKTRIGSSNAETMLFQAARRPTNREANMNHGQTTVPAGAGPAVLVAIELSKVT